MTVQFRKFAAFLTILALVPGANALRAQQTRTHPIKCANPELSRAKLQNPKGKIPQHTGWAFPTNFDDSLASPSGRYMIYFDLKNADADNNTALSYAQLAANQADSAYDFEMGVLGYTPPALTIFGHYAFVLAPEHSGDEAYGETRILEGGQLPNAPDGNERWRAYSVVDNSFESSIYATHGGSALRITIFHEFFHVTHFFSNELPAARICLFPGNVRRVDGVAFHADGAGTHSGSTDGPAQRFILDRLADPEAVLVLDETAELKQGQMTSGWPASMPGSPARWRTARPWSSPRM